MPKCTFALVLLTRPALNRVCLLGFMMLFYRLPMMNTWNVMAAERLDEADQKLAAILQQHPKVRARVQQRIRDSDFSKAKLDAVQKALQDYIGELQTALDEVQTLRGTLSKRRKNG